MYVTMEIFFRILSLVLRLEFNSLSPWHIFKYKHQTFFLQLEQWLMKQFASFISISFSNVLRYFET